MLGRDKGRETRINRPALNRFGDEGGIGREIAAKVEDLCALFNWKSGMKSLRFEGPRARPALRDEFYRFSQIFG